MKHQARAVQRALFLPVIIRSTQASVSVTHEQHALIVFLGTLKTRDWKTRERAAYGERNIIKVLKV